jgi:hypothetical protein
MLYIFDVVKMSSAAIAEFRGPDAALARAKQKISFPRRAVRGLVARRDA